MSDRQNEIRRLAALPSYLEELRVLTGRSVNANDLLPEEETALLRDKLKCIPEGQVVRSKIPFAMRNSPVFAEMLEELHAKNSSSVVLWPPKANECGLLEVPSVRNVEFDFPFDLIPEGILVVATRDGQDRLLLDFGDEDDGERSLEIELHGPNWSRAKPATLNSHLF